MATTALKPRKTQKRQKPPSREAWLEGLNYAQRQRLRFFDAKLLWEGRVTREDVRGQFGVTKNHFTRDVSDYREFYPQNFELDAWKGGYRPKGTFKPVFATGQPEEYLALLRLYCAMPIAPVMAELGTSVPTAMPLEPAGKINQRVLSTVLRAIHGQSGVTISYQSFTQEEPSTRTIWPHALIWSGERWYARAFDSRRKTYLDMALQRIIKAEPLSDPLPGEAGQDVEWQNSELVEVIPNPQLSKPQQKAIADEYGMDETKKGYVWRVELRRCLIPYFLQRHRLDDTRPSKTRNGVPTQRILVKNPEIVKKYAFPAD